MAAKAQTRPVAVAFLVADSGNGWIGGANYLRNLLKAISELPDRAIKVVLFVSPTISSETLAMFPADRVVRTALVLPRHPMRLLGKLTERISDRNIIFERLLRRERIDLVSHALPAGGRPETPTLSWIADFQELHIPDFFSTEERAIRREGHDHVARGAHRIILSSEDAQHDLATILPQAVGKSRILRFTSGLKDRDNNQGESDLRARYALEGPFFHLPNQFWIHKNHRCVIDALAILRQRGIDTTVVCTGHTGDYRHPDYFASLQAHAKSCGVSDLFRIEGLVPYPDVAAFMKESVAVINPSLFEGWSTTVEESKAQGKRIILSDIGVHREQAPERGLYFPPDAPAELATHMAEVLRTFSPSEEKAAHERAAAILPERFRMFAQTYQNIVLEAFQATQTAVLA